MPNQSIEYWLSKVDLWYKNEGGLATIKRIKSIQLAVTNYLCQTPLTTLENIKLSKDGLPASLGPILPMVRRGDTNQLRLVMTLLKMSRLIKGEGIPSLGTIETKIEYKFNFSELDSVITTLRLKEIVPDWDEPHLSIKAGPNGQALISSIYDLSLLPNELKETLIRMGGEKLKLYMDTITSSIDLKKWMDKFPKLIKPKGLIRRLSIVQDPEAKTRVIGILDYWSQTVLKELNSHIESLLRTFKSDCTFNQSHFKDCLPQSGPYWSLDLSKATDSFPVDLQEYVLARLSSEQYAKDWKSIMVDYEFYVPWEKRSIKYRSGQPMGAYTSWSMFTLCHHLIVQLSAKKAGLMLPWKDYALLGDDIVLTNYNVVKHYKSIMDQLGVSFSKEKSHVSKDTYEFAKRWIHKGVEITGAPLRSFIVEPKYSFMAHIIRNLEKYWYPENLTANKTLFQDLFSIWYNTNKSLYYAKMAIDIYHIPQKGDSEYILGEKVYYFLSRYVKSLVGCNLVRITDWTKLYVCQIYTYQLQCMVEEGIKASFTKIRDFITSNDLGETILLPLESSVTKQDALMVLPVIKAAFSNAAKLQLTLDWIEGHEWHTHQDALEQFHMPLSELMFDPSRSFEPRRHQTIIIRHSKLQKNTETWLKNYELSRSEAMEASETDSMTD